MPKSQKTRKDPGRTYITDEERQEKRARRSRILSQLRPLVYKGTEAKQDLIAMAKEVDPDITQEEIDELVTLFLDAVWYEKQRG